MEIKKIDKYCELILDNIRFVLDPPNLDERPPIILTDFSYKLNKDKIFNSPGEYNIGDVYFQGFDDKKAISYLFVSSQEGKIFYNTAEVTEETLKKIKLLKIEIDALITKINLKPQILSIFKPKVIFTFQDLNLPKFQKEKTNKVKINLAKVKNIIYHLQ